jgi:hypothetical protein
MRRGILVAWLVVLALLCLHMSTAHEQLSWAVHVGRATVTVELTPARWSITAEGFTPKPVGAWVRW